MYVPSALLGKEKKILMTLFMMIDNNNCELPMAVADSKSELARMLGIKQSTITRNMASARKGICRAKYIEIECEDDDD